MSIEVYLIMVLSGVAFVIGLMRAYQSVTDAQKRVAKVQKAKKGQIDRLRRAARNSLSLKRTLRDALRRKEITRMEVDEAEVLRRNAEAIDHRLFVLDERRTKADQNWVTTVTHPNLAEVNHNTLDNTIRSWQTGRRFLVYALDEQKARDKVMARYPERLGYRLTTIAPQGVAKATKAGAAKAASA